MKNTTSRIAALAVATILLNVSTSFGAQNKVFFALQHYVQLAKNDEADRKEKRALNIRTNTEHKLPGQVSEPLSDTNNYSYPEGNQVFFNNLLTEPSMSEYTHSKSISKIFCKDSDLINNNLSCEAHIYKLRHRDQYKRANTNLNLTFRMLTYADEQTLQRSAESIYNSANPDTGLSYAWDHLITKGTKLYWLHAPCTYSEKVWDKLVLEFENAVSEDKLQLTSKFTCACGLPCRKR